MKIHDERAKQLTLLLASLTISILLSFIPKLTTTNTTILDQVLLTMALFSVCVTIDILWSVTTLSVLHVGEHRLWTLRDEADHELANIRSHYVEIARNSYGETDLFTTHFLARLRELSSRIRDVAERQELRVQADHFLSAANVLDAFQGDRGRIWRYSWPISSSGKLFDDLSWRFYFEATATMAQQGAIAEIRTLLIVDDWLVLDKSRALVKSCGKALQRAA